MRTGTILFCTVLFLVVGCAELPRPINFPTTTKEQIQSAYHWQIIARKLVRERLTADPKLQDLLKPDSAGDRPLVSIQASNNSPFDEAFRNYLITELMDANFKLSDTPDGPINIRWSIQPVYRDQNRWKYSTPWPGYPEMIAEAVWWSVTGLRWNTTDIYAPHTEVILTTWITVGEDSLAHTIKRYSDTFYINDDDNYHYQVASNGRAFSRSIAAQDEAWRRRLARQGLLSQ